jgi:hypothetical protein
MALFKAVLCGRGEIVDQGYTSRFGYTCVIQLQCAKTIIRSVKVSTRILIIEVSGRLVGENKRMIVGERSRDRDALLLPSRDPPHYSGSFNAALCACGNTVESGSPFHDLRRLKYISDSREEMTFPVGGSCRRIDAGV